MFINSQDAGMWHLRLVLVNYLYHSKIIYTFHQTHLTSFCIFTQHLTPMLCILVLDTNMQNPELIKSKIQRACDFTKTARVIKTKTTKSEGNSTPSNRRRPNRTDKSHCGVTRRTPQTRSQAMAMQAKKRRSSWVAC